jgi:hypothetical protein
VHHGAGRKGGNLLTVLYTVHEVVEGVSTVETRLPSKCVRVMSECVWVGVIE